MQHINSWKPSGRISLWRYTEPLHHHPGWHLHADAPGCASLLSLMEALATDGAGGRTLTLAPPSPGLLAVPNNRGSRVRWVAPETLRIRLLAAPDEWSFPADLDPALLSFGCAWLTRLRAGIADIPGGRGGYAIGIDHDRTCSELLWFWR